MQNMYGSIVCVSLCVCMYTLKNLSARQICLYFSVTRQYNTRFLSHNPCLCCDNFHRCLTTSLQQRAARIMQWLRTPAILFMIYTSSVALYTTSDQLPIIVIFGYYLTSNH